MQSTVQCELVEIACYWSKSELHNEEERETKTKAPLATDGSAWRPRLRRSAQVKHSAKKHYALKARFTLRLEKRRKERKGEKRIYPPHPLAVNLRAISSTLPPLSL